MSLWVSCGILSSFSPRLPRYLIHLCQIMVIWIILRQMNESGRFKVYIILTVYCIFCQHWLPHFIVCVKEQKRSSPTSLVSLSASSCLAFPPPTIHSSLHTHHNAFRCMESATTSRTPTPSDIITSRSLSSCLQYCQPHTTLCLAVQIFVAVWIFTKFVFTRTDESV